ncbi:hypothetical protein [Vibrio sp. D431a]|uniref:hypothetical protein n=1 Tax=Vibrio sp. D431a TaxID=2837388 RepID=UPI00255705C0|nr:hypothetical protein [Vibrio sp. D431a]MDK9793855.1 hypothetical protein [Vibrio sp. D431a]
MTLSTLKRSLKDIKKNASAFSEETAKSIIQTSKDATQTVNLGISNTKELVSESLDTTTTAITDASNNVKLSISKTVASADNKVQKTLDETDILLTRLVSHASDAAVVAGASAVGVGISSLLVTPIIPGAFPLFVAIAAIESMMMFSDMSMRTTSKIKKEEKSLQLKRVAKGLKRYGVVTEDAVFKSDKVEVEIDSLNGEIDGVILKGEYKGIRLSDMDKDEIVNLIDHKGTDKETKEFLKLYTKFREC